MTEERDSDSEVSFFVRVTFDMLLPLKHDSPLSRR